MENRLIKDAQITASSEWDSNHAAIQARLNFKAGGGKQGAWSARSNDANQWIQVALGSYTKLTSIATQGRIGYSQWVTKYKLQYSDDGVNFHYYKASGQKSQKVKPYPQKIHTLLVTHPMHLRSFPNILELVLLPMDFYQDNSCAHFTTTFTDPVCLGV